jgi:hypothetical protein
VLDGETQGILESGCGLIVGFVRPDGAPFPCRAWGLDVLDASAGSLRVLVATGELRRIGTDRAGLIGASMAATGSDVRTLHTVQVKGTVVAITDATPDDVRRARRHTSAFFDVIVELDQIPREALERMVPIDYVSVTMSVSEAYDQTPGPGAGARMETGS